MTSLAPTLQAYFTTRLISQYGASPHTVAAYRDTWRLLLGYAAQTTGTAPASLDLSQLDADLINGFLTDLETQRGNGIATRNARLAAVHSFLAYASRFHPEHLATIGRVLAIPPKRRPRNEISYLTDTEVTALLAAPNQATKAGRRDHAMFQLAVTAGLRVCELTGLQVRDVHLGAGAHVLCRGKGRKNRTTPLGPADRASPESVHHRTTKRKRRIRVPHPNGNPDEPRRRRGSAGAAHRDSRGVLPQPDRQDRDPTRAQTHRGDAAADRRNRHHRHRALARTRKHRNHPGLPARRHDHEGERRNPHHAHRNPARTIQATRRRPDELPPKPLIMPTSPGIVTAVTSSNPHHIGIIRTSA
jgi:site-specific recombinase XerD